MLTILLSPDWVAGRDMILSKISGDVADRKPGGILIVPELISHDTERRLCKSAGDTASRYAEVLSFPRLTRRVSDYCGVGIPESLDNGGRIIAMASAVRHLHSQLKAYAAVETRPEFLKGLLDAVDEFKRCCIKPADLKSAAARTEGALAQKLEELSLILETYDALCTRGKRDPRDQMSLLLEELEDSDFALSHRFYIDGFPDFTGQHLAIIEHFIRSGSPVTVNMNCDSVRTDNPGMKKPAETTAALIRCAKKWGIEVKLQAVSPRESCLYPVAKMLFQGQIFPGEYQDRISALTLGSVYDECVAAAQRVMEFVQNGARYRDIGIVCSDMGTYQNLINMVFNRCGIPSYLSGTEAILDKSVISTVLAGLDAALNGFDQREVFKYIRSPLSPLGLDECDRLENYAILWNIRGRRWLVDWMNHPEGLGASVSDSTREELAALNQLRRKVIEPLVRLADGFKGSVKLCDHIRALYQFLDDISLAQRLDRLAGSLDQSGNNREAQILNQLWEILLGSLEQTYDVLGETAWDPDTFTRLLKLLLSQYDVGTIPPVLDAVTIGPVSFMRCHQTKHLIVLGASEGSLPAYSGSTGVLTDQERMILRNLNVPLTGGAMDGLMAEFSEIYGTFCGAECSVDVYCPSGRSSFVFRRLCDMAGGESESPMLLGAVLADKDEAGALFVRTGDTQSAYEIGLKAQYDAIIDKRDHKLGGILQENVAELYGNTLRLSASQIDKFADCRLSYFLKYGLKVKERKAASVDPAEFGSYVHAVLENTAKEVMEDGGFREISLDDLLKLAEKYSGEYAKERFGDLDTERARYLFNRNSQELIMIIRELWEEMQVSDFVPVGFEVSFGDDQELPAIDLPGKKMDAKLSGFVDRVDLWEGPQKSYFRVVDYKTGKKSFDYCDVFNGYGLQMLLYLFALEEKGIERSGGRPAVAGVQYFPARAPYISADGAISEEEAEKERTKQWKRSGLILNSDDVIEAMDPSDPSSRLPIKKKKDGTVSGDLADLAQLKMLKKYIFGLVGNMVDEIAAGCVDANPYTRGGNHDACAFCPYGSICGREAAEAGRRNYKKMEQERFWEEVQKEVSGNG